MMVIMLTFTTVTLTLMDTYSVFMQLLNRQLTQMLMNFNILYLIPAQFTGFPGTPGRSDWECFDRLLAGFLFAFGSQAPLMM